MYAVDRDGLDGMLALPSDRARPLAGAARGAEATSGLYALANAASAASAASAARRPRGAEGAEPLPEAPLASWSALAPIARVADDGEGDTRVDLFPPDHVRAAGRPARVTLPAPMSDESMPPAPLLDLRPRRSARGLVLGLVAAAAAAGLFAFVAPRLGDRGSAVSGVPVSTAARPAPAPAVVAQAATPGPPPPRRPATLPSAAALPAAEPRWSPPNLPAGAVLEWRLPAHFAVGATEPEHVQDAELRALVATLVARCSPETIELVGHTCTLGGDGANKTVGKRRAREARDLLIAHGLPLRKARTRSAGSSRPETENETAQGRERNRRVTIACQPKRRESRGME